jgi:hypothetical protein
MWRAFGTATGRVGLVFNIPARSNGSEAMRLTFSPVAYFKNNQADQLVAEVVKNIHANITFLKTVKPEEICNWIFYMLLWAATCTKHESFWEEKEWRAVHCPDLYPTELIKPAIETVGGVPQSVYILPLDKTFDPVLEDLDFAKLFDRLIIGPTPYPTAMFDAYNEALVNAGVLDAGKRICISGIPIRS